MPRRCASSCCCALSTFSAISSALVWRLAGRQHGQVDLDVVRQRQPGGVDGLQHRVIEGQVKALLLQGLQRGQARCDFMYGGMTQRRDFQHHLVGGQQLQMLASQAFVRAVDEHELGADQILLARMGEGCEHQGCIGCHGVAIRRTGAIEQLVANDLLQPIDDGLACNHAFGQLAGRGEGRVL